MQFECIKPHGTLHFTSTRTNPMTALQKQPNTSPLWLKEKNKTKKQKTICEAQEATQMLIQTWDFQKECATPIILWLFLCFFLIFPQLLKK